VQTVGLHDVNTQMTS